jgi:ATP-dependent DNA helicase RecG
MGLDPAADHRSTRHRGRADLADSERDRVALDLVDDVPDLLPDEVRREHDFVRARQALTGSTGPRLWARRSAAERLRFDEAFVTQPCWPSVAPRCARSTPAAHRRRAGCSTAFDERLPFTLTAASRRSAARLGDLAAGHPMHRLLQGEVGSGKTVVALRAMLRVVDSGGQAALLAPTEVLAQQHHRSITRCSATWPRAAMLGGAADGTRSRCSPARWRAAAPRGAARRRVRRGRHRDRHPRAARGAGAASPTSAWSSSTSSTASASSSGPR